MMPARAADEFRFGEQARGERRIKMFYYRVVGEIQQQRKFAPAGRSAELLA